MNLTSPAARRLAAATITCTAIVLPAAALASPGPAAAARSPASQAGSARPVTAYVISGYPGMRTVPPIDAATNTAGKAIKIGGGASAIAITPNGKTAYVVLAAIAGAGSLGVVPIQTATKKAGKTIPVGLFPGVIAIPPDGKTIKGLDGPVAITPDGKTVYAVSSSPGTVTAVSTATNKPGKAIKVGSYPIAIAITP